MNNSDPDALPEVSQDYPQVRPLHERSWYIVRKRVFSITLIIIVLVILGVTSYTLLNKHVERHNSQPPPLDDEALAQRNAKEVMENFLARSRIPKSETELKIEEDARNLVRKMLKEEMQENPYTYFEEDRILIFVMIHYNNFQRRHLMRSLQFPLLKDYPIDYKFVVGTVDEEYLPLINDEIKLYNDIIVLNLTENVHFAITRKFYEALKYIKVHMPGYKMVCKMDGDAFLNMPNLWPQYIKPNLNNQQLTLLARLWDYIEINQTFQPLQPWYNIAFVGMSWNLASILAELYQLHFLWQNDESDEYNLAHYMKEDIVSFKWVVLPHDISHDYSRTVTNMSKVAHVIKPECIYVHELKDELKYIKVASCFDKTGFDVAKSHRILNQTDPTI
jgi:hypothetical protein